MKKVWVCVLLASISQQTLSQNLVPNFGFESLYDCPGSYNHRISGKLAPGWTSPTYGTPDLFHACSIGDAGVPTNWAGYSKAYTGSGYAGIYLFLTGRGKQYREYLQAELITPLEAGAKYQVEFYYKLSSNSKYSIDRIGFLLSDSAYRTTSDGVFPAPATYEKINRTIYSRATGLWTRFGYVHEAKGGERYLTIGNFSNDAKTRSQLIANAQGREPMLATAAYFYIDDVKVIMVGDPPKPVPLTGYPDIVTNKDYILKNIQFEFNEYSLIDSSFVELKKLLNIMRYHKTWKVVVSGHTDDVGTEAYNLELSINRASSVVDYLLESGIDPERIKAQGFGKQAPLVGGTDDTSRAINRRVELRFLN